MLKVSHKTYFVSQEQ